MMTNCSFIFSQCDLGCNPGPLTIALGETGQTVLEPSYFLAFRSSGCLGKDSVEILETGNNIVDCSMIGGRYTVKVTNLASGNFCQTDILVSDRLIPQLIVPDDITIHCDQSYRDTSITGGPQVTDNCSFELVFGDDVSALNDCSLGAVIRTWRATDEGGNSSQLTQKITIIDTIPPIVSFPSDITLHCDQDEKDLSLTGAPVYSDNCGNLDDSFSDLPFSLCGPGTKRILRNWTVADFCNPNGEDGLIKYVQTITIRDTLAPTFTCQGNDTLSTDPALNVRWTAINGLMDVSDNCSGYMIDTLVINSSGDTLSISDGESRLSIGDNRIEFFIEDFCGNRDSCDRMVRIEDYEDPMIICIPSANISISGDSTYLSPITFYRDVSDNVTPDSLLKVEIVHEGVPFDSLPIDCSWATNELHDILIRVTDEKGNFNQCQSSFYVWDISAPRITCPADLTVSCGDGLDDLGEPDYFENCTYSYWFEDDDSQLNACGLGTLTRKWVIKDGAGLRDSCYQSIEIISSAVPSFIGPSDITIDCGMSESPSETGEPILMDSCSQLIWAFVDREIQGPPGTVKVIERTFEIVDDCNNSFSEFHEQKIFIRDVSAPELTCIYNPTYYLSHESCEMEIDISTNIQDDCNLGITLSHNAGRGMIVDGTYSAVFEKGQYQFEMFADDGLGNLDTALIFFTVLDTFPPLSVCRRGLSMALTDDGWVRPNPELFDFGSEDNCSLKEALSYEISPVEFNCWDQGLNNVVFTVIDESGNRSSCNTDLLVQDPQNYCPPLEHSIRGQVLDGDFRSVYKTEVVVVVNEQDTTRLETDEYGWYQMDSVASGSNIQIFLSEKGEVDRGLSTLDLILLRSHLLELDTFQSPYQYIAGDVNKSGQLSNLDISIMRGILLKNLEKWPGGSNYNAIPFYREFSPLSSILEMNPEEQRMEIDNISEDIERADFIISKTGDINHSAFEDYTGSREACDSVFFFSTKSGFVEEGEEIVLRLENADDFDLLGLQFILKVDVAFLEYVELRDLSGIGVIDQTHYNYNTSNDELILTWDQSPARPIDANTEILEIVFRAREDLEWPGHITVKETEVVDVSYTAYDICSSEITSNEDVALEKEQVKFYPNPVRDQLYFESTSNYFFSTFEEIIISNVFGAVVIEKKIEQLNNQSIMLNDLLPGLYMIGLKSRERKSVMVGKFLKI